MTTSHQPDNPISEDKTSKAELGEFKTRSDSLPKKGNGTSSNFIKRTGKRMSARRRFILLALIMIGACTIVMLVMTAILYRHQIQQHREILISTAHSQVRLIEAIARHQTAEEGLSKNDKAGYDAFEATIEQVIAAHGDFDGFASTVEFTLAHRYRDSIIFILRQRHDTVEHPIPVPFASELAEPMRLALQGLSGTIIGLDYRGETVLAAYEPVAILNLGIVAKIDLSEIRTPFIRSGLLAAAIAFLVVLAGAALFFRIGNPLIARLETYTRDLEKRIAERTLAEKALRESGDQFKAITEGVNSALLLMDDNGKIDYLNPAAIKMFGYSQKEALGQDLHGLLVPAESQQAFKSHFPHFCRTGQGPAIGQILELTAIRKNGQTFPIELSISSFQADNHWHAVGIVTDISERKQSEKNRSENIDLINIINSSFNEIYIFSAETLKFKYANPAAISNLGYSLSELRELTPVDIKPEFTDDEFKRLISSMTRSKTQGSVFEALHERKNGSTYPAEIHLHCSEFRGNPVYVAFVIDISKRKKIQQQFAEKSALLEAVHNSIPDAIVTIDLERRITAINPAFTQILGYKEQDILGKQTAVFYESPEEFDRQGRIRYNLSAAEQAQPYQVKYRRKNDEVFTGQTQGVAIIDVQGKKIGFMVVIRDISAQIDMEQQLRQTQKLEVVGTLASGIAHDFNNILAPIIGYTQLLREQSDRSRQDHEQLSVIMSSSLRAKELVEQILKFSRQTDEGLQVLNLKQQIKETAKLLRASISSAVQISLELQEIRVIATPSMIHQLLLNLCTNAAHAMKDSGGELTINLEQTELETGHSSLLPAGSYALLSISDSGHGITAETLPRIFEPYFTTKDIGEGSGIGLATVHRIVTSLGGNIRVESGSGQGCTFSILLPETQQDAGPKQKLITPLDLPEGDKRLMLVDDEQTLIDISGEFLQSLGYQVTSFTSSEEALRAFEQQPDTFDLLITDLSMPELTGVELSRQVSKIRPELPIIICTGQDIQLSTQKVPNVNLLKILQKPDLFTELAFTIHQHFAD